TDLFHQAASVLLPLSTHLLQVIAAAEVVWADETPVRVLDVKRSNRPTNDVPDRLNADGRHAVTRGAMDGAGCFRTRRLRADASTR
ncbi:transposase, partial [Corallococcus coralloides]|nr:transposase [Corallococcus coralloides]